MSRLTPEQRRLRAELGAHALWARQTDRSAQTAKARRAFTEKLEREVDPEGILPPEERAFRAEHLRKAHMKRMALAASMARTRRKKGGDEAVA
jgi:hypothetical protein